MALNIQLSSALENFNRTAPEGVKKAITEARLNFIKTFDSSQAIQPGQKLPPFSLPNAVGSTINSDDLLAQGPILIAFYRGSWCPFCNYTIFALQQHLADFRARGVTLVAISPELPNQSLTTVEKHALEFPVLSDRGNKYAEELGLLFRQPNTLRPVFEKFGHDLKKRNGDDSLVVPVPATLLVGRDGIVRNTFVEPDYTKRVEPTVALEWVDALKE